MFGECMFIDPDGTLVPWRMVRRGRGTFFGYGDDETEDRLFDIASDPLELRNVIDEQPEVAATMRKLLRADWDPDAIVELVRSRWIEYDILVKWGAAARMPEPDRWEIPPHGRKLPHLS